MGWIRTNDGYPIDLQSTALDRSATTSYKKKKTDEWDFHPYQWGIPTPTTSLYYL